MSDLRQAAQQALEALENERYVSRYTHIGDAITALRAALAAAVAEPAKLCECKDRPLSECPGEWEPGCDLGNNPAFVRVAAAADTDAELERRTGEPHIDGWPLYSGLPPPQRERKPLTDEQIDEAWDEWFGSYGLRNPAGPYTRRGFARAIERAHGIAPASAPKEQA